MPKVAELRSVVKIDPPSVHRTERALARAHTIEDLRTLARRRTPTSVFDYVDGAAEQEASLARSKAAYAAVEFRPRVLRDVANVNSAVEVLGATSPLPLVLAPTGFTRMMHHEGELAVGRAAAAAGIPYVLSTMGTTSVEELAAAVPDVQRWFQLYLWQDRERSRELIARAEAAGYGTLMLTVDTVVGGKRLRDIRNGLTIPPSLTLSTLADMATKPRWWANLLTTEPLEFASLTSTGGTVEELIDRMFDPRMTLDDLSWLREQWSGQIVVKGIQHPDDARAMVDHGVEGIVISNHGGRQLDRATAPLELLPEMVEAVGGRAAVLIDGGITNGADLLAARAGGADAAMVGRAYLYGLMAGGQPGVTRALEILTDQVHRAMRLLGVTSLAEVTTDVVRLPAWESVRRLPHQMDQPHPQEAGH